MKNYTKSLEALGELLSRHKKTPKHIPVKPVLLDEEGSLI